MPICKGARLKVERANHHIADLESRIGLLKEHLICTAHLDAHTGCEFIECDFAGIEDSDIPGHLAVIIGDAVHNLKSALDHVWLETITRLVRHGDWERTSFRCYAKREELESALKGLQIHITAPGFFALLMDEIQSYDRGNLSVRSVHKLDLRDKHRLLIPVIHYSSIGDIQVEENGEIWPGFTGLTPEKLPHRVYFKRGIHVKQPGRASFDVMFDDGDAGTESRAADTLRIFSREVLRIIETMERFIEP